MLFMVKWLKIWILKDAVKIANMLQFVYSSFYFVQQDQSFQMISILW